MALRGVGALIAEKGKRLVSGFGLVVGGAAISGALKEDAPNLDKSLMLRPFPQEAPDDLDEAEFKRRYREGMLQQAGVCVIVSGEKDVPDAGGTKRVIAEGVLDEFDTARRAGRAVIPIGATGGAAAEVWRRLDTEFDRHWPKSLRKDFDRINDSTKRPSKLVESVGRLLDHLDKSDAGPKNR